VLTETKMILAVCPKCGGSGEGPAAPIGVASKELFSITTCDSSENYNNSTWNQKPSEPRKGFRQPKTSKHWRQKQNRRRDA